MTDSRQDDNRNGTICHIPVRPGVAFRRRENDMQGPSGSEKTIPAGPEQFSQEKSVSQTDDLYPETGKRI